MIVEVVEGEIREHSYIEGNTENSFLRQCMRRYLHYGLFGAITHGFGKDPVELERLRRGVGRRGNAASDVILNCAYQRAFTTTSAQDRFQ